MILQALRTLSNSLHILTNRAYETRKKSHISHLNQVIMYNLTIEKENSSLYDEFQSALWNQEDQVLLYYRGERLHCSCNEKELLIRTF